MKRGEEGEGFLYDSYIHIGFVVRKQNLNI